MNSGKIKWNINITATINTRKNSEEDTTELNDIIDDRSSDEELYQSLEKINKKSVNSKMSMSTKILQRKEQLSRSMKKIELEKLEKSMKISNNIFDKSFKYAEKYKKKII